MISAEELRIGNHIRNMYGEIIKVDLKILKDVSKGELYGVVLLTEQILLKCGFDRICDEWNIENFCMELFNGILYYSAGEGVKLSNPILYLHQLQNLVYSLTGRELDCTQILHNEII